MLQKDLEIPEAWLSGDTLLLRRCNSCINVAATYPK